MLALVMMAATFGRVLSPLILLLGFAGVDPGHTFPSDSSQWKDAPPPAADQTAFLDSMRHYARDYVGNLPNFTCDQVTQQFEAGRKPIHWHKGDTLTSKLVFSQGHEERTLEFVNDKPVRPGGRLSRIPLSTEGEFGILLSNVFGQASQPTFEWSDWQTIEGKRVAGFRYSIDATHSTMRLSLNSAAQAVVPYHGTVYGDPSTGIVWLITNIADHVPDEVRTRSISTTVQYGEVAIADNSYVLPVHATVLLNTGAGNIRNELEFKNYRRFGAESTIIYSNGAGVQDATPR